MRAKNRPATPPHHHDHEIPGLTAHCDGSGDRSSPTDDANAQLAVWPITGELLQAWKRIHRPEQGLWADWMLLGEWLLKVRQQAMTLAKTNQPMGRGYNSAMSALLIKYGLGDLGETARVALLKIMQHREEVEEWRGRQDNPSNLNNPTHVWGRFQNSAGQQDCRDARRKPSRLEQALTDLAAEREHSAELEALVERLQDELESLKRLVATEVLNRQTSG